MYTMYSIPCSLTSHTESQQLKNSELLTRTETNKNNNKKEESHSILKEKEFQKIVINRLSKTGKQHDVIEYWLGQHNRKLEVLRTLTSFISASASTIVLLKIFSIL